MFELLRVYLGYCSKCHMPKMVGEFKLQGWQHAFNLCDLCISGTQEKLQKAETEMLTRMQNEPAGSRI